MKRSLFFLALIICAAAGAQLTYAESALIAPKECPGAPPQRLTVGAQGQLTQTQSRDSSGPAIPVRVHATAGTRSRVVGQLTEITPFQVIGGPQCRDRYSWWQINSQGLVGWIAEGDSSGYFVEPFDPSKITPTPSITPTPAASPTPLPVSIIAPSNEDRFGDFKSGTVQANGSIPPYPVAPDFGNVVLADVLTASQLDFLQRNGFVLSPGSATEFYTVYQQAHAANQPLLITADSMLHITHLAFDKVQRTAETERIIPALTLLNKNLLTAADINYQLLKGSDWEATAKRAVAYIGVGARLLDPAAGVPTYASDLVNTEIANINSAASGGASAIFPESGGEDWTQYLPRGHYTLNDSLKTYFQTMTYYGRMTFRLSNADETKSALVLMSAMSGADVGAWEGIYEATAFFTGRSDSLSIPQFREIMDTVYGKGADIKSIQAKGVDVFVKSAQTLPATKGLAAAASPADADTFGFRLMGGPITWDAYVFSQLITDQVGTAKKPRPLPMGLDVLAALGSDRAYGILDVAGVTAFDKYPAQMTKLRAEIAPLKESDWTSTLYGSWLMLLNTLDQPVPGGYPGFMSNQPYTDRQLYSALGYFSELKHDTQLLAYPTVPQSGNRQQPVASSPNYVEPLPVFWSQLAALVEMTRNGLDSRHLLDPNDAALLTQIWQMAHDFQQDSQLELANQALPADEQTALGAYGDVLNQLMVNASENSPRSGDLANSPSTAMIADVAADPVKNRVLEIGTGDVADIYAIVPIGGKLYLTHGAAYTYYEFAQSAPNRLTNDTWQTLLDSSKAPTPPDWTFTFLTQDSPDPGLESAVDDFRDTLAAELQTPIDSYGRVRESTDKVERFLAGQLEPLAKAHQYEDRTLVETNFRSLNFKDSHTAVIVAQETWRGELHNIGPDPSQQTPTIGTRGPYTVDMTYTLSKDRDGNWAISDVTLNGDVPTWSNTAQ